MMDMSSSVLCMGYPTVGSGDMEVSPTPVYTPRECNQNFKLWYGFMAAIGGLVLISLVFISIVLLYKCSRRSKDIRYIYQTKPMKSEP